MRTEDFVVQRLHKQNLLKNFLEMDDFYAEKLFLITVILNNPGYKRFCRKYRKSTEGSRRYLINNCFNLIMH